MGYDIAVIDKRHRFESRQAFDDFYRRTVNSDNEYDPCDYHNCTPSLQRWFLAVKDVVRPINTVDSQEEEEIPGTYWGDYDLMPEVIHVEVGYSDISQIYGFLYEKAKECDVAFFDISGTDNVYYPDDTRILSARQEEQLAVYRARYYEESAKEFHRRNKYSLLFILPFLIIALGLIVFRTIIPYALYYVLAIIVFISVFGYFDHKWIQRADSDVQNRLKQQAAGERQQHTSYIPSFLRRWADKIFIHKIVYIPIGSVIVYLAVIIIVLLEHDASNSMMTIAIWTVLLLFFMWKSMDNIWLFRRLKVMSPNHYRKVRVEESSKEQTATLYDPESGVWFSCNFKEKNLYISTYFYTDPLRYQKEYEERMYQFETRMKYTKVPMAGSLPQQDSAIRSGVSIKVEKQYATPANIAKIRNTFISLKADDYQEYLYARFPSGNDQLYVMTYQYRVIKAVLITSEGEKERVAVGDSPEQHHEKLSVALQAMYDAHWLDGIKPENIISEHEFLTHFNTSQ